MLFVSFQYFRHIYNFLHNRLMSISRISASYYFIIEYLWFELFQTSQSDNGVERALMILRRHWQATTNWSVITRNLCGNIKLLIASKNSFNDESCKNEQKVTWNPHGANTRKQFDVLNSATVFWPHSCCTTRTNKSFFLYNCWWVAWNYQQIIIPYIILKKFRVRRRV